MAKYDVTKLNVAVDKCLGATTNPRHRFLLQAYSRHRYLEVAGRYEEIFAPEMMAPNPTYHFHYANAAVNLTGEENVKSLYRDWAETNQSIFYAENEQIAVADNFIASVATLRQQVLGKVLATRGIKADENAMYLRASVIQMFWPYDDRGRLIGEDVWEPDPDKAQIVKLDPADVLTTAESRRLLDPLIKPLPSFDEKLMAPAPTRTAA